MGSQHKFKVRYLSESKDHWCTPEGLYQKLDEEFLFDFDPCPLHADFDGLSIEWGQRNYVNSPYSDWCTWVKKAIAEHEKGRVVVER